MSLPFSINGFPSPEDMNEHMQRAVAESHASQTRIWNLFSDITPDHLATLIELLGHFGRNPALVPYHEGLAAAIMKEKHHRCTCGEDHDFEALETERLKLEEERKNPPVTVDGASLVDMDALAMATYRLIKDVTGAIKCKDCGMEYQSLDDRMVKRPDDCSGCKQKAAWG